MLPEVRDVQVAILIHAVYSRSSHACHLITLQLPTGSLAHSSFRSRLFYLLKCCSTGTQTNASTRTQPSIEYLDKCQNSLTSPSKSTKTNSSTSTKTSSASLSTKPKYIKKYILQQLPQVQPLHHSHAILTRPHAAPIPPPHSSHAAPTQQQPALTLHHGMAFANTPKR